MMSNINLIAIIAFLIGSIFSGLILWIIYRAKNSLLEEKIVLIKQSYESLIQSLKDSNSKLEENLTLQAYNNDEKIELIESNFHENLQFEKNTSSLKMESLVNSFEDKKEQIKKEQLN